jgi:hypothetical protein
MSKAKKSKSRSRKSSTRKGVTTILKKPDELQNAESLERSLIEKLGLYEEFPVSHDEGSEGRGDVESE